MNLHRELAGRVFVDHGGIAIVDRQYVTITDSDEDRILDANPTCGLDCGDEPVPPTNEFVGVWSATGVGDGRYPVYVDLIDTPDSGIQVARIVIDCLGTEPDPASADLRGKLFDIAAESQNEVVTDAVLVIEALDDLPLTAEPDEI
jgi:hypothetical protein